MAGLSPRLAGTAAQAPEREPAAAAATPRVVGTLAPRIALPRRDDLPWLAVLVAIAAGLLGAVTYRMIVADTLSDYEVHLEMARVMATTRQIVAPQLLFHLSVMLVALLPGIGLVGAGILVAAAYASLLATVTYQVIRPVCGPAASPAHAGLAAGLALGLLFIAPVTVPTWPSHNLYLGYVGMTVFHNPTVNTVKPLALLLWLAVIPVGGRPAAHRFSGLAFTGVLAALATLAKPNYTLCLLPALAVVVAWRLWRREQIDWPLLAAVIAPAVVVLAWQYGVTYATPGASNYATGDGIAFAPLAVVANHTSMASIAAKLGLSILFPLAVYALHWREARQAGYLNLSWIVLAFGLAYAYLLAEGGDRHLHGNFLWGAQTGAFVVFVATVHFWVQQWRARRPAGKAAPRLYAGAALLGLHLICGLLWCYTQFVYGQSGWW
jgi:hypothetical protein